MYTYNQDIVCNVHVHDYIDSVEKRIFISMIMHVLYGQRVSKIGVVYRERGVVMSGHGRTVP